MNSKVYKWCAVPLCKNTSKATPNKVFVYVPNKKAVRDKWLRLAQRDPGCVVTSSPLYFCEDHFDLPNDMENYMQYHLMGSVSQVRMKPGCIPKNFACQADRIKRTSGTTKLPNILRKRKMLAIEECAMSNKQLKQSSIVTVHFDSEEIASGSSDIKVEAEEVTQEATNPCDYDLECVDIKVEAEEVTQEATNPCDYDLECLDIKVEAEEVMQEATNPCDYDQDCLDIKVETEEVTQEATNPCDSDQECLGSIQRRLSPRKKLEVNLGSFIRYDVDTEQVIYEVSTRPVLWDSSHTLYKNQCARVIAWLEIYQSLFPDYYKMEYNTQKQIGKLVQMRWKTARDAYMKYKNLQKSSGDVTKKYTFSDIMTFLDKIHSTDTVPVEYSSASQDTNNATESEHKSDKNAKKTKRLKLLRKKKSDVDDTQHVFHKDVFTLVKQNLKLLQNDDIAFFMSLLPVTEKFSQRQKLMFRAEVLKIAMDISKNT